MLYAISTALTEVTHRLEEQVQDVWTNGLGQSKSSIAWSNTDFNPAPQLTWLEPYIRFGESAYLIFKGTGSGVNEKVGELILTITMVKADGATPMMQMMDAFQERFGRGQISGIETYVFDGPTLLPEQGTLRAQLTIGFRFYESY